jgi:cellulose synthase/poly-beta-1,6-N-acetylglucosamine synthase-like glycosyltransferase
VRVAVTEPRVAAPAPPAYLPAPPDDREKYAYFGPPRRWVFCWLLVAAAGVLYGYIKVAERAWLIAPVMWLLLMVMVPPVVVNFWLRTGRPRLSLAAHQATVARYRAEAARGPAAETVDVFLPSCGEPLAVLDNTFRHVSALTWHGPMTVYALDDSARADVRDLADRYGFRYVVRPRPGEMKKAGNLAHALGISSGDFIAVIDADFAVRPEFLYETMPYFDDAAVGIVQTAQYYDVTGRSFSYIQRYAGTLQEIFFRFIQPARDRHKAAICAGTNLIYRRAAVRAAGGFAQVPIGEDVHSGVKLWWAGFETRYLPLCLAKGVAPTDFPSLANQQARWCRSSMMLMTERHFIETPFSWQQRTAFWAAFLYYMSSAALLLTGPFPTLTMIWCYPGRVYPHNYLPILPALAASLFAFPVLSRGWRPTIYRVCVINSCCHLYSVWSAIRGRVAEWVPTGASPGRGQVPVMVNRILCTWIVAVQALLWAGLALRVHQYGWQQYWATEILGGIQLYMVAPLMTPAKGVWKRARPGEGTA